MGIDIDAMWKLRDDVLTGKAPAAALVAVFDKLLEELEVRRLKARRHVPNKNQLELWGRCLLCGRQLDVPGDKDSVDCGGDCAGCVRKIEEGQL